MCANREAFAWLVKDYLETNHDKVCQQIVVTVKSVYA
jgi:hypothetical protein